MFHKTNVGALFLIFGSHTRAPAMWSLPGLLFLAHGQNLVVTTSHRTRIRRYEFHQLGLVNHRLYITYTHASMQSLMHTHTHVIYIYSVRNQGLFIGGCQFKMLPVDSQNAQVIGPTPSIHPSYHRCVGLY